MGQEMKANKEIKDVYDQRIHIIYEYSIIFNLILLFKDFYKFNIHSMINPLFCYTIKGIKALRLAG